MKISKIDDATLQMIQQYQRTDRVEDRSQEKPEKAAASLVPEEKVNLSTTAKDVQTLKNAISSLPACASRSRRAPTRSMRRRLPRRWWENHCSMSFPERTGLISPRTIPGI